jgi:hypothetical protein
MPPIKSSDVNKIKEKIEKCYEKKEWYDQNGKVKKALKSKKTGDKKEEEKKETNKEEASSKSTSPSKPVANANVMDDLLDFNSKPAKAAKDEGNPFEDEDEEEEEEEEKPEDDDADFADFGNPVAPVSSPPQAKTQNAVQAKAPAKAEPDLLSVLASSQSNPAAPTNLSPEADSLELLVRSLKEIGMKHKFSKEKMLSLVEEACVKVNLKTPGMATQSNRAASVPQLDPFAEAEKQTTIRAPVSVGGNIYGPPSNGGLPGFGNVPPQVNRSDNPFEEDSSNPFAQSPPKNPNPMMPPPMPQMQNPGAQGFNPFGAPNPQMMGYPNQFPGMMPQFPGMMPGNGSGMQQFPGAGGMMPIPPMNSNAAMNPAQQPPANANPKQQKDQELFRDFAMFK